MRRLSTVGFLELPLVAQRIHALPKAVMAIGRELAGVGERHEGVDLETAIVAVEIAKDFGFADEKAAVDPAFADLRFLGELADEVAVENHAAESRWRPHGRHRRETAARAMERDEFVQVDIRDAVAVGEQKRLAAQPGRKTFDAAAGVRVETRVDEVHDPVFAVLLVIGHFAVGEVDRHASRETVVIDEIAFDDLALVAEGDQKLLEAERGVVLHDVPEDRPAADFDHRLWPNFGFLGKASAESAGENDGLHGSPHPGPLISQDMNAAASWESEARHARGLA
jgi:hypothetical protein